MHKKRPCDRSQGLMFQRLVSDIAYGLEMSLLHAFSDNQFF